MRAFSSRFEAADPAERRRIYMTVLVIVWGGGTFLLGAAAMIPLGEPTMAAIALVAGVGVFSGIPPLRRGTSSTRVASLVLYMATAGQTALQVAGWTLLGPAFIIYPILVMMASATLEKHALYRFTGVVFGVVCALLVTSAVGVSTPGPASKAILLVVMAIQALFGVTLALVIGNHARSAYEGANRERDESERRLRLAVKGAKVGVWEWSAATNTVEMSPSLATMIGQPSDAPRTGLLADLPERVLTEDGFARFKALTRHVLETGEDADAIFQLVPSREGRWFHVDLTAERGERGEVVRIVGAARDITRARLEEERRSQFIASMSHELRTPLNGVLGMAELMNDEALPRSHRRRLQMVLESGYHMLATINDVLDFERIEAGAITLTDVETDLRKLVASLLSMFAPMARSRGLMISAWVETDVPEAIRVDSVRLSQILVNLVGNAIKYTDEGHVTLGIARQPDALVFTVTDTGVGIPEDQRRQIFHPFERLESGTRRTRDGQGLGLAISLRLARLLDGALSCESTVGEGSTFELRLARETPPRHPRQALRGVHGVVRIAYPEAADVVARTLREAGATAEVIDATTTASEVAAAIADRPAIIFISPSSDDGQFPEALRRHCASALLVAILRPEDEIPAWADGDIGCPVAQAHVARIAETLVHAEQRLHESGGSPTLGRTLAERYPMKLMVVEDDPISRLVASGLFEREGYDVRVAPGGDEAVEAFEQDPVDLILMDLHMPKVDGFDATRAIRALDHPQPVVIAYTADTDASVLARLTDAGADGVLLKPTRREHMVALLRAVHRGDITPRHPTLWTASPADAQAINDATPPPKNPKR